MRQRCSYRVWSVCLVVLATSPITHPFSICLAVPQVTDGAPAAVPAAMPKVSSQPLPIALPTAALAAPLAAAVDWCSVSTADRYDCRKPRVRVLRV